MGYEIEVINGEKYKVVPCDTGNNCDGCYFKNKGFYCPVAERIACGKRKVILKQLETLKSKLQTGMVVCLRDAFIFQCNPYFLVIKNYRWVENDTIFIDDILMSKDFSRKIELKYFNHDLTYNGIDCSGRDIVKVFYPARWPTSVLIKKECFEKEIKRRDKKTLQINGKEISSKEEALKIINEEFGIKEG